MILAYGGTTPTIEENVFIAPTAVIIGDVTIKSGASIWYGTVVRGDRDSIVIGANSNIQDNCTIHTDPGLKVDIGEGVVIGHNAVIHGCVIESKTLIGIGSTVLNMACIKSGSVVAAGSVVREKQVVGPLHLVAGAPAVVKRDLDESIYTIIDQAVSTYCQLARDHKAEAPKSRMT